MQTCPKFERKGGKFKRYYKMCVFYRFSSYRAKFRNYERIWKIKVVFARFAHFVALSFCHFEL